MENTLSIIAIVISVISFLWTWYVHNKGLERERRQATLDAFNALQCQVLDQLSPYTKAVVAEIAKNPRSPEYKELSKLLARCEHFAVGVNQGIYDLETVRRLAAEHLIVIYSNLEPLITKKRSFKNNEGRYKEFEQLVNSLKK